MIYIKKLILRDFKGYKDFTHFSFQPKKNILIGDNGIGKTTIVQALRLLLKGSRFEYNGLTYLAKYINESKKQEFLQKSRSSINALPSFSLILVLGIEKEKKDLRLMKFEGEYRDDLGIHSGEYGITFTYKFDEQFESEYKDYLKESNNTEIPFSMYKAVHRTFADIPYHGIMDPLKSIFIDNDNFEGNPYNQFAHQIYNNLPDKERVKIETKFRVYNQDLFSDTNKKLKTYKLNIDPDSLRLSSIIDVESDNISLQELGSGKENLIKTKLSLDLGAKLIVVEEPENHLTANNTRKQIEQLDRIPNQLIVTSHNSQIVTGLDLNNIIWIKESNKENKNQFSLNKLSEDSKSFFKRRDDIDFLRLITAKNIILVEGAAEYILMRTFIKQILGSNNSDIEVISIRGRYYAPFIDIVKNTKNRMVIFTDNDSDTYKDDKDKRLNEIKENNIELKKDNIKIFCDSNIDNYTFEVSEYYLNQDYIDNNPISSNACTTKYKNMEVGSVQLAFMLNHKSQSAISMLPDYENGNLNIPDYIVEGLKWLKE